MKSFVLFLFVYIGSVVPKQHKYLTFLYYNEAASILSVSYANQKAAISALF